MEGVYKYSILEDLKLIIQFYQNDITLSGMKKMKQSLLQDKCYNSDFRILTDLRLSNISTTIEEVEEYGKWIGEKLKSVRFNSNVILTSTPQQVSKAILFNLNKNLKDINYTIFSSLEGSLKHLDIDISNIGITENVIEKMIVKSR